MLKVRTRFAPSPTGYIHVGNVRSALYPFFIARQAKGDFILRIEDTDQNRYVEGAEELIIDILQWLGITWDEGPVKKGVETGQFGPYHQTERKAIYQAWAQKLIDSGYAYADPRSKTEIEELKQTAQKNHQLFLYREHRPVNPPKWDGSTPLRFKVRKAIDYQWEDQVMGKLSAGKDAVDDFIIIKSDGLPTYNFAHIIDDMEMKISHVIRGQEYISSMPKYLALYDALGIERPIFAHLPHIMAPSGNKKLGKRDGAKSVADYRLDGYLPEAILNFLACLGWNDGTTKELYTIKELIESFSLNHVQRSGARFDEKRLLWLNGQWIKRLDSKDLANRAESFWGVNGQQADQTYKEQILNLVQDRLKTLADLPKLSEYFFARPIVNWSMIKENKQLAKYDKGDLLDLLKKACNKLSAIDFNNVETIQTALNQLLIETNQKPVILFSIIRYSLTWAPFSPDLPSTMLILGKDETLERIKQAVHID